MREGTMHATRLAVVFGIHLMMSCVIFAQGFHSVHAPTASDVWAVGDGGTIYRSSDGGASWFSLSIGPQTFRGVFTLGTAVWIVGENGAFYRSTNLGGSWTFQTINGGVTLRSVFFASASNGWAVGDGGTIAATTDGGANWSSQTSGTSQRLNAVAFSDAMTGYVAGAGGVLRKTTNGGASWTAPSVPGGEELLDVDARTSAVFVVGQNGFGKKSTNGGVTWTELKLNTDTQSDVTGVYALSADSAFFIGGGGYIRLMTNGGATSRWGIHQMHGRLSDIHFFDHLKGWAISSKNLAVLRTTDGGATWQLPIGTTVSQSWSQKITNNSSIGNTFALHPTDKNTIYVALGSGVHRSTDLGETWAQVATITGGGSTHSFYVSRRDPDTWMAAHTGGGDRISRTTNAGSTWTATIVRPFTSYGMPLEVDPDDFEVAYFAPDGTGSGGSNADGIFYKSLDFGATWDTLAQTGFRSPCDIVVVPDSTNLLYVGDGITGSGNGKIFRSTDRGLTWTLVHTVSGSEIPMIGISRLRNKDTYATAWGSGGVAKTTNYGANWSQIMTTGSAWGVDVSKDDPNFVMYGVYGGALSYLSVDAGATFSTKSLPGSNYSIFLYDRETILAQTSQGVFKLGTSFTVPVTNIQTANLLVPSGGEVWQYNSVHNITWASGNVTNVRIELKTSPAGSWQTVVASTPAVGGSYAWTIPNLPTSEARVRIMDASDGTPADSSASFFSITVPSISSSVDSLDFGTVNVGGLRVDTIRITNAGTGTLVINAVTTGDTSFAVGRTSFTIPPGSSDTLSVVFRPISDSPVFDTLRIGNNSPDNLIMVALSGTGVYAAPLQISPPNGALYQSTSPVLAWNALPAAASYRVQVATDSLFAAVVKDTSGVAGTLLQVTGLVPGTTFRWRVNADTVGGNTDWSAVWKFSTTNTVTNTYAVAGGWNMISVPLAVDDPRRSVMFPTSASMAYAFGSSGYTPKDTLQNGTGYWLKFGSNQNVDITGGLIGVDTITVNAGWNMIGSISAPVAASSIIEVPSGLVMTPYYRYNGTYSQSDTLHPAKAYWVKALVPGQLILAPLAPVPTKAGGAGGPASTKKSREDGNVGEARTGE